jgi:hypothetical protein
VGHAIALGHWAVGMLPWQVFNDAVVRLIGRLPPCGALPLFLIPVAVIEPLKIVAIQQITHGHLLRGVLAFAVLKFVGVGLVAFVFDLTREKLLAIGWFARFYCLVEKWRDKAHEFIEPYKVAARADRRSQSAHLGHQTHPYPSTGKGGLIEMLTRVRARVRRAQG